MPHFVRRLETPLGHVNFYFNLIHTAFGDRYLVSTVTRDKKTIIFQMLNESGHWRLVDPGTCPNWLVDMERSLAEEIAKHQEDQG